MATQSIDIVNNPANPANPTTEQLLALPAGGTVELYGDKPGTALQVRVTGLKREAEHAGQFLIEGFVRLPGEAEEARVESSFYNAATGRGTLHVEARFAERYQALSDAIADVTYVPRPR
ncbi:hypothetical protein [Nannocystis sp. SCPEA4]|jgi:hypothetical protein|uniref:hypothetical protein n=1 Tax=Nannocystis sp. SCPEA4 TaxID=2996787 RepID=UPI00226EFACD|nr:hypothetical protein [Nannocystis sp. SCPEA4]MCY1060148.1 hypothetical protein [Nannocystis sp. SCPEA4]